MAVQGPGAGASRVTITPPGIQSPTVSDPSVNKTEPNDAAVNDGAADLHTLVTSGPDNDENDNTPPTDDTDEDDVDDVDDLDDVGDVPTVSRTEKDNGVVGRFEQPEESKTFEAGHITISTVSGDSFVQMTEFMATGNVIVCVPRKPIRASTAYFIAAMVNGQKSRYSYGRQCYLDKLASLTIRVPWREGAMDEAAMEQVVKGQPYWSYVQSNLQKGDDD